MRLSTLAIGISTLFYATRLPINGDRTSLKRNWLRFNSLDLIFSRFIYYLCLTMSHFTRNSAVWFQNRKAAWLFLMQNVETGIQSSSWLLAVRNRVFEGISQPTFLVGSELSQCFSQAEGSIHDGFR